MDVSGRAGGAVAAWAALAVAVGVLWRCKALRAAAAGDWAKAASASRAAALSTIASQTDDLTGALRRDSGYAALQQRIDHSRRSGVGLILVFVDVDGMKQINDLHGHQAGDRVLAAVAAALQASVDADDVVMRFGGDEFIFCVGGETREDVIARTELLQTTLGHHRTSVSAGYAELLPGEDLEDLIARADADLYGRRSRRMGRRAADVPPTADVDAPMQGTPAILTALADRCIDLLDVHAVQIVLRDGTTTIRVMATASGHAGLLGGAHLPHNAGPCTEAFERGEPVIDSDLAAAGLRWPRLAAAAVRAGNIGVHAVPIHTLGIVTGSISVYRRAPAPIASLDVRLAQALADLAGLAVSAGVAHHDDQEIHAVGLGQALREQRVIEQAKGMLAQHGHTDIEAASATLSEHARTTARRVPEIAEAIVAGTLPLVQVADARVATARTSSADNGAGAGVPRHDR